MSREEQVEGYSLDYQARACREEAAKRGWEIVAEFAEEGRSAKTDNIAKRPEFRRMMEAADAGRFEVVIVHKLDRFSRNLRVTLDSFERLAKGNVAFVSVAEAIDYSTPSGRLFLAMLGALAEWFSMNLSQETKKGKAERKAQGLYNGLLPFGLVKGEGGLPVPDVEVRDGRANWDGYLLALRAAADEGRSDAEIAGLLNAGGYRTTGNRGRNLWRKDSIRRLLTNRIFLGELPDGRGGYVPGKHPAYVERQLWDRAQAARSENRKRQALATNHKGQVHSLSGLLRCWYCEEAGRRPATIQVGADHGEARTYCYNRHEGLDCPQRGTQLSVYERQVESWLAGIHVDEADVERVLAELRKAARPEADGEAERKRLEARLVRLRELYEWGDLGREEYQRERDEVRAQLRALAPAREQRREVEHLASFARSVHATWLAADQAGRNKVLGRLVARIVVRQARVVAIAPRPEVAALVPAFEVDEEAGNGDEPGDRGGPGSSWSGGSDGDWRPGTTVSADPGGAPSGSSRYSVPHNLLPPETLAAIAVTAAELGIAAAARRHGVSRPTVRRALRLAGLASPWAVAPTPVARPPRGSAGG